MNGIYRPIVIVMDEPSLLRSGRWRNLITGECRSVAPRIGDLDWVEVTSAGFCPD
jgi:hypothetical protein